MVGTDGTVGAGMGWGGGWSMMVGTVAMVGAVGTVGTDGAVRSRMLTAGMVDFC